ncbi:MAG TPA: hypothetical protein VF326_06955 [Anaerolineaceae bacterium]|jgi:hypothetical protein
MDSKTIDAVCKQVYSRFPEVNGCAPKIQAQELNPAGVARGSANYLFVFNGKGTTANGKPISRTVRVVVTERGKIIKMTTSR